MFKGLRQESLVLQRAVGYCDVYRIWLILRSAYSLKDGIHKLHTKDIATLYEIWCFITLKNIVKDYLMQKYRHMNVENRSRIELNRLFSFNLSKGENSCIIFKEGDIELVELIYNPNSDNKSNYFVAQADCWDKQVISKTVVQRPDIVLRLSKSYSEGIKLTYLFDAKYRIDNLEKVTWGNGAVGFVDRPPEDAINQMHRYRDAILFATRDNADEILRKEIVGGYILFPGKGKNDVFEHSKLIQSQSTVNIGAFPLRPSDVLSSDGSGVLLRRFVHKILEEEALSILAQSIPQKGLEYKVAGNERVFVGVVTDGLQEYAKFLVNKAGLYYTGKTFPSSYNIISFKYFAPYFRGEGIRGYYDIIGIRSATKAEMLQNHDMDNSVRFFFQLGEYHELSTPIFKMQLYKDTYADVLLKDIRMNRDIL